jgi:hypothetical protein
MDYTKMSKEQLLECKKEAEDNIAAYERTLSTWKSLLGALGLRGAIKRERKALEDIEKCLATKQ